MIIYEPFIIFTGSLGLINNLKPSISFGKLSIYSQSIIALSSIIELICDDLRYQDKQNDPQYLMLSNKLREEKRINKVTGNNTGFVKYVQKLSEKNMTYAESGFFC